MDGQEFDCYYGSGRTEDTVYVYNNWYVVHGSRNVNKASSDTEWQDGIDVETITDVDTFSNLEPINSLEELIEAVES